jgi:hypothetical protein
MYLTAYHFDGEHETLMDGYERMFRAFPPASLSLHLCIRRDGGMTIIDGCPSREVAEAFWASPELRGAVAASGLPEPRIEALGEVHRTIVNEPVGS